ncbi:SMI1 / KNR4 family protein [Gimesia panareensis]|uniref:SMI1 / KNR4 family protein n=1 Tax=Gimesia panareensis TaxID=2527978 RepID=A0A518FZ62_9PLAN|nr:SMI1/KNR4 family protein [Gimesia panareensis]QDV21659.1 SMI1 / KNR4 family protein [Gimesia panareensis]
MTRLCQRWERWLKDNFPSALETLQEGATPQEVDTFSREIGFVIPEDVREWFMWKNGQVHQPHLNVLFGFELLTLSDSLREWRFWQTVSDMNEEFAESCKSYPNDAILPAYTTPGWIPIAKTSGPADYLGIDLNPGPEGTVGQVINFGRNEEKKCVAGVSLADFLEFVLDEYEAGHTVVNEYGIGGHDYFYLNLYGELLHFSCILSQLHEQQKFDGRRLHIDDSIERIKPYPPELAERLRRLHFAALNDDAETVIEFLDADPELVQILPPGGNTILHTAAMGQSPRILDYLERFKLDSNARNDEGETPLTSCEEAFRDFFVFEEPSKQEMKQHQETLKRLHQMGSRME